MISDLRCVACVWLIERVLRQRSDVTEVLVNFANRRLQLTLTPDADIHAIARQLYMLGYSVRPDTPDADREAYADTRRNMLIRMGVAGIGMMQVMMFALAAYMAGDTMEAPYQELMRWASMALTTPVVFYSAWPFHRAAWFAMRNRSLVMDVPVSVAILAAWVLSVYNTLTQGHEVYYDTACMFTFFLLIGRYAELASRFHFQQSQDLLHHLLPARAELVDGREKAIDDLQPGDTVRVAPGAIVPADGTVITGISGVSEDAFTGEPLPQHKTPGSRVLAGSRNHDGVLDIRVSEPAERFVIRQIARLYDQASHYRPRWAQLADRTARYFVGAVLLIAAGAALFWYQAGSPDYLVIALTVLVVACPCALSLATPVAYSMATTTMRRHGVIIKHGAFLERAAATDTVVFDKTGTLTEASLSVQQVQPLAELSEADSLELASALERVSQHPIALAFQYPTEKRVTNAQVVAGSGVTGVINGDLYRLGQASFSAPDACMPAHPELNGVWILLSRNGVPLTWFCLRDTPRAGARDVVAELHTRGLATAVLTGDRSMTAEQITRAFGIQQVRTGQSPEDKVAALTEWQQHHQVLMVGDGINDTAAMAAADTSLCVSPRDIFVQNSADATLIHQDLNRLPAILSFARRSRRVIRQNIAWSVGYNFTVIPFALLGMVPPWLAALGMSLSSVLVVANAARLRRLGH